MLLLKAVQKQQRNVYTEKETDGTSCFTLTNEGRDDWLGLFTMRNLKFLCSTSAGAPGCALVDLR